VIENATQNVPAAVGEPLISPVRPFSVRPGGRPADPKRNGPTPLSIARVTAYSSPTRPSGRSRFAKEAPEFPPPPAAFVFIVVWSSATDSPSFAVNVTSNCPTSPGMPVIVPDCASRERPEGIEPLPIPNVTVPPAFAVISVATYSPFVVPSGSVSVRNRKLSPGSAPADVSRTRTRRAAGMAAGRRRRASMSLMSHLLGIGRNAMSGIGAKRREP